MRHAQPSEAKAEANETGYRHRAKEKARETLQSQQLRHALLVNRQCLSHATSRARDLANSVNEQIGQAVIDGIPLRAIAVAASETARNIRLMGVAFQDLHPSQEPAQKVLARLTATRRELQLARTEKAKLEEQRDQLLVIGYKTRVWDPIDASTLCGLNQEQTQRLARGLPVAPKGEDMRHARRRTHLT